MLIVNVRGNKMSKILVDKKDLEAILTFREGTSHYNSAEQKLRALLAEDSQEDQTEYDTVKWWRLTHKRHYENKAHVIKVPKCLNDIEIEHIIRKEFLSLYSEISEESGFRWNRE